MARGQPTSGTHLITFERAVSLGGFDGHTVSSPGAPATAEAAGDARGETRDRRRASRGHILPMVAGITMVIAGLIAVGYGLFGLVITNFITAHEQTNLSAQFADRQAMYAAGDFDYLNDPGGTAIDPLGDEEYDDEVPVMIVDDDELSGGVDIPGAIAEPLPTRGDALGRIVIPKINVDWAVVSGVRNQDLRKGPGHMTGTPLPGQYGNSVISGHRTTYGGPFSRLDELDPGDRFTVETLIGTHTYEVVSSRIVGPSHTWVVRHREGAWLTLTTCHPKFSSQQRLIVFAKLVDGPNHDAVTAYHGTRYDPPEPPEGTSAVPRYVPPTTTTTIPQSASVTAPTPAGTAAGDLLLAQVTATGGASATISPPGGWTLVRRDNVGEDLAQAIFRRIAVGGEPSAHTFHVAGGGSAAAGIVRVSDVDPQDPLWGSTGGTGAGTSLGTPGLTTGGPGTMIAFFGIHADTGLSTPGGFTQQFTTASGGIRVLGAVRSVGSGATGGATSGAGAAGPWIAQTVVVRSAAIPEETTTTTVPETTTTTGATTTSSTTSSTTTTTTVPETTTTTPTTTEPPENGDDD